MAGSSVNPNTLRSRLAQRTFIHDPSDASEAHAIAWADLGNFENFMASVTVTAGAFVTFKLYASASVSGSNPVLIRAHETPSSADAVGDTLVLEASAAELPPLGAGLRYVAVEIKMSGASDTACITYTRGGPRFGAADLTADYIS